MDNQNSISNKGPYNFHSMTFYGFSKFFPVKVDDTAYFLYLAAGPPPNKSQGVNKKFSPHFQLLKYQKYSLHKIKPFLYQLYLSVCKLPRHDCVQVFLIFMAYGVMQVIG
jgi:hypothetical protein